MSTPIFAWYRLFSQTRALVKKDRSLQYLVKGLQNLVPGTSATGYQPKPTGPQLMEGLLAAQDQV